MTAMKLPLPTLISVIIGFTNIIPFFGPFIGAIPSTLIIFLIDPIKAIYFLIMVFVLQQIDGNIIGPRILGESTGLASFWVMFAIIVGGGIFGFVGMILGVPLFAVFYYYFSRYIKKRLAKKSLPTETIEYEEFKKYNINKEDLI
jgi:predicted PurR-regulated permease PerM